jgi:cytochrome c oxidase assembly factor CtaG
MSSVRRPGGDVPAGNGGWQRSRGPLLAGAAVVISVLFLVPPLGSLARRYVYAESLQFAAFGFAVPALIVLAAPWPRWLAWPGGRANRAGRAGGAGFRRAAAAAACFLAVAIAWRLPPAVDALARYPGLAVAELLSLAAAGSLLWLELVPSPPFTPRSSRPQRAAIATVTMWIIWVVAYVLGFARAAWYTAYPHLPGHGISVAADQQLSTWILWAVPALCFVPVVSTIMLKWLREPEDVDAELKVVAAGAAPRGWPRPPRGWRTPAS